MQSAKKTRWRGRRGWKAGASAPNSSRRSSRDDCGASRMHGRPLRSAGETEEGDSADSTRASKEPWTDKRRSRAWRLTALARASRVHACTPRSLRGRSSPLHAWVCLVFQCMRGSTGRLECACLALRSGAATASHTAPPHRDAECRSLGRGTIHQPRANRRRLFARSSRLGRPTSSAIWLLLLLLPPPVPHASGHAFVTSAAATALALNPALGH